MDTSPRHAGGTHRAANAARCRDRGDRPADDARRRDLGDRAAVPARDPPPARERVLRLARASRRCSSSWSGSSSRAVIAPGIVEDLRGEREHVTPRAEIVHWLFASGFLLLGLLLLAEAIVGRDVWRKRVWRTYLWPSLAFGLGVLLWPVSVFFTNSTLHMVAHASWAETAMIAGGAQLALVARQAREPWWTLTVSRRDGRQRGRVSDPRAEPLAVLPCRIPPSRARLDASSWPRSSRSGRRSGHAPSAGTSASR